MKKWEYKFMSGNDFKTWNDVETMNALGAKGWEMVNFLPNGNMWMKREIEQRPAQEVKRERPYNSYEQDYS